MTVYVDNHYLFPSSSFRGMRMSHMIADTEDELHALAASIGMKRAWYQGDHYDVGLSKRRLAIQRGAVEITWRLCAVLCANRRETGELGDPATAEDKWREIYQRRKAARRSADGRCSDGVPAPAVG